MTKCQLLCDTSCTKNLNLFVNLVRVLPPCQVHPHVQTDLPLFLVVGVLQLCPGLVRMTTFPLTVHRVSCYDSDQSKLYCLVISVSCTWIRKFMLRVFRYFLVLCFLVPCCSGLSRCSPCQA